MSLSPQRANHMGIHGVDPVTGRQMPPGSYFKSDAQLASLATYGTDHITGESINTTSASNGYINTNPTAADFFLPLIAPAIFLGIVGLFSIPQSTIDSITQPFQNEASFFSPERQPNASRSSNRERANSARQRNNPPEIVLVTREGSLPLQDISAPIISTPITVVSCVTAQNGVNVRVNPVIRADNVIASVPFNTVATHTGPVFNVNWQQVEVNGVRGYIRNDNLRLSPSGLCPS